MAKSKKTPVNVEPKKSLLEKIADTATHLKEELIAGKDHFVELSAEKLASVKSSIQEFAHRKKAAAKKSRKKTAKKAPAKKSAAKKSAKKSARKPVKKAATKKAATKKRAGVKKKSAVPFPKKKKS